MCVYIYMQILQEDHKINTSTSISCRKFSMLLTLGKPLWNYRYVCVSRRSDYTF